jgi:hypothetical protein
LWSNLKKREEGHLSKDAMIKIKVPADVHAEVESDIPGKPLAIIDISLRNFIVRTVMRDAKWGKPLSTLYAGMEIRGAFNAAKEGDIVELTHDQYEKLMDVLSNPTEGYNPAFAFEIGSFFEALRVPYVEKTNSTAAITNPA